MIPDPDANVDGETPAQAEPEAGPGADEVPDDQEIDFVTLGMFIIGRFSCRCEVAFDVGCACVVYVWSVLLVFCNPYAFVLIPVVS